MKLPKAIMRAWGDDSMAKLGGWIKVAGGDPSQHFCSKAVTDHPWVGLTVSFPLGIGSGKVIRCITHPRGELMFDVEFPRPVHFVVIEGNGYRLRCSNNPKLACEEHRYFAHELKAIVQ